MAIGTALVGAFVVGRYYRAEVFAKQRSDESDPFLRGQVLERGRRAWFEAANLHMYLAFFESERLSELPDRIEGNLWYSIPDLYQFTSNSDASAEDRKAAMTVLRRIVLYFYEHPRQPVQPQEVNMSEEVAKAAETSPLSNDPDSNEQKVYSELAKGAGRALSGFDNAIEGALSMLSEADREIQAILDVLIEQREFPGSERTWGGMTIHLPKLSGRSGGGSDNQSFDYRGEDFNLVVTQDRITLNGRDYGEVHQGSIIDFRVPKKVFVDGKARRPITKEAQQDGTGQPATRPESKPEGSDELQPESEGRSR